MFLTARPAKRAFPSLLVVVSLLSLVHQNQRRPVGKSHRGSQINFGATLHHHHHVVATPQFTVEASYCHVATSRHRRGATACVYYVLICMYVCYECVFCKVICSCVTSRMHIQNLWIGGCLRSNFERFWEGCGRRHLSIEHLCIIAEIIHPMPLDVSLLHTLHHKLTP